jgi:hypothetical protein
MRDLSRRVGAYATARETAINKPAPLVYPAPQYEVRSLLVAWLA